MTIRVAETTRLDSALSFGLGVLSVVDYRGLKKALAVGARREWGRERDSRIAPVLIADCIQQRSVQTAITRERCRVDLSTPW